MSLKVSLCVRRKLLHPFVRLFAVVLLPLDAGLHEQDQRDCGNVEDGRDGLPRVLGTRRSVAEVVIEGKRSAGPKVKGAAGRGQEGTAGDGQGSVSCEQQVFSHLQDPVTN